MRSPFTSVLLRCAYPAATFGVPESTDTLGTCICAGLHLQAFPPSATAKIAGSDGNAIESFLKTSGLRRLNSGDGNEDYSPETARTCSMLHNVG